MNFLVLGGNGFIGSHLVDELASNNNNFVRSVDRGMNNSLARVNVEYIKGDFNNKQLLDEILADIDIVYDTIWTTIPSNDNAIYDIESNVVPTLQLLNKCVENKIKKIIFTSSGGTIYGNPMEIPISEKHPTNPICSYGISKLTIEKYLQLYFEKYNLNYAVLRCSNPFGERQNYLRNQGLIITLLYKAIINEPFHVWGDGTVVRDYIYIKDLADAHVKVAAYRGTEKMFNIGSGIGLSINETIHLINNTLDIKVPILYEEERKCDVEKNILNIERAKNEFNWCPEISIEEGIVKTWEWLNKTVDEFEVLSEVVATSEGDK